VKYSKGWKRKKDHWRIEDDVVQTHICLGTECLNYQSDQKFDFLVLNTLLGGGMSSRLFQSVREKYGLAYSVYTFTEFLSDTGIFGVYVGTDRTKIQKCIDLIRKEFQKVCKESISKSEMDRIKSQLKGNLLLGLESTSSRMNRIAKMEIYLEKYYSLDDIVNEIDLVSPEKVKRVAKEVLSEEKIITTVLTSKTDESVSRREK
jgi:predicted Zn-dependent peptidase